MSGHSKWHNIQKTKGAADAKRSAAFTKIAKEIIVAVKQGGSGDPANNSRLATVIAKAKANNMPNDNIKRTIDKALGSGNTDNYESVTYEGYGPGGVAVIVEALTDNRQRTAPEVRHYFDKFGKGMGAQGCVSWSFDRKGVIIIDNEDGDYDEDTVMMDALEAGAADFTADGPVFEITTDPDAFNDVIAALEAKGYTFASADISLIPQTTSSSRARRTSRTWKSCSICSRTTRTCRTPTTTGRPRTKVHRNNEKTDGTPSVFPYSCEQDCKPGSVSGSHLSTRRVAAALQPPRERSGRPWGAKPLLPYRCCSG